jgi:xanthine dehydrogenase molybdopterin-binding subunit B
MICRRIGGREAGKERTMSRQNTMWTCENRNYRREIKWKRNRKNDRRKTEKN